MVFDKVKRLLLPKTLRYKTPMEIHYDSHRFYQDKDLVYFKSINAYGAFKHAVVKDILLSGNDAIGVSTIALGLNSLYFSVDENVHRHNKKVAVKHLTFLAPKHQFADNNFTQLLFDRFFANLPKNHPVDLTEMLVNPIVFIHVLHEYDLLETVFFELNPNTNSFSSDRAIEVVKSFLNDADILESTIVDYLDRGGEITRKMTDFANSLRPEKPVESAELPKFLRSIIFVAIETTTSFVSTLIYVLFTQYNLLLEKNDFKQEVYNIANELLRLYPPVPFVYRTVWADTEYNGIQLKKGALIMLFIGAANQDSAAFENPTSIQTARKEHHLSFGAGSYACIGRFAGFRMAMNMLNYLLPYKNDIEFLDQHAKHFFHNAIQKLPLKVVLK